ncbi:Fatty acid desaturase [Luteitalea pratensis]|uniref:Fatty acid desaturase n=1 Tax=Luteitalea pratensis TaxID=1855912 RepID=A0A143PSM1_LUTPR|nr:fatty acid desaturase [Luteitalea pratensis]AMY11635.1 Fatty acid desaturase [Luteitalea pratensis]
MPAAAPPPAVTYVHGLVRPIGVRVPREWYVPNESFGWRAVVVLFGVLIGCVAALPWLVDRWGVVAMLPVLPVIGAYVYKITILMHECCHRTLFRARATNDRVGLVCGGFLVTGYDGFCRAHWQHHRHCGTEEDGEESDYMKLQDASAMQLLVHLVKPLLGVQAGRLALAALAALAHRFGGSGSVHAGDQPASQVRTHVPIVSPVAQLAAIGGCQLIIAVLASGFGRHPWLVIAYPVTAATFGLFFSRVRAFCEHVRLDRHVGECSVRSHLPNPVDRLFFYTLNMNLHVEHHLFPQVPACHLPAVRQHLQDIGYLQPAMTSRFILGTIAGVLGHARARRRVTA